MGGSAEMLGPVMSGLANAGIDVEAVLTRLAKECPAFEPGIRFDNAMQVTFWRILERVTEEPDVGLYLCSYLSSPSELCVRDLFAVQRRRGSPADTFVERVNSIGRLVRLRLVCDEHGVRIAMAGATGSAPELRHTEVCAVYAWLQAMAQSTCDRFVPAHVRLWGQPRVPHDDYEFIFHCSVEFTEAQNEIWLDPHAINWLDPALLAGQDLSDASGLLCLQTLYEVAERSSFARRALMENVRWHVKTRMRMAARERVAAGMSLADMAADLGISARYLRFILSDAGTSFRRLVAEARFSLAAELLRHTTDSIESIATQLGYSEPSTFRRAFKRWSGMPPGRFRSRSRHAESGG